MLFRIRLGAGGTFDGTTVIPSTAKLVQVNTGSTNLWAVADSAGLSFTTLGVIPISFFADKLGSSMIRVVGLRHDAGAGVTAARVAGGYVDGSTPVELTGLVTWNPTQSRTAQGFPCPNREWVLILTTNGVGVQTLYLEILPADADDAFDPATDSVVFDSSDLNAAPVASVFTDVKTSAYTAGAGQLVQYNTSGGAFSIEMPAAPLVDDVVGFIEVGNSAVNALTIDGNGHDLRDPTAGTLGATATYQIASGNLYYKYDGTQWQIIGVRD